MGRDAEHQQQNRRHQRAAADAGEADDESSDRACKRIARIDCDAVETRQLIASPWTTRVARDSAVRLYAATARRGNAGSWFRGAAMMLPRRDAEIAAGRGW
ncbi:hypothetical protein LOC51_19495 [Rubrivivax sp. JA1024]|nr:hypothetical protein [Rubrivivax sp. JA1024]